jgi:hypothetical protein
VIDAAEWGEQAVEPDTVAKRSLEPTSATELAITLPERLDEQPHVDVEVLTETTSDEPSRSTPPAETLVDASTVESLDAPALEPVVDAVKSLADAPPVQLAEVREPEPIVVESRETLQPVDLMMESDAKPIAVYRSEPMVIPPIENAEQAKRRQQYRSPVAVKQVPIALSRSAIDMEVHATPTVRPVNALALEERRPAPPSFDGPLTSLPIGRAKVRSLTVGGNIDRFEVEDEGICQVLRSRANELKLIGIQNGTTRLIVHATTAGSSQVQARGFEIRVSEAGTQTASPLADHCARLNHSLAQAFPRCQVTLSVDRNRLIVAGNCDSNETAREILRMVRKACLVPVQDQLVIQ